MITRRHFPYFEYRFSKRGTAVFNRYPIGAPPICKSLFFLSPDLLFASVTNLRSSLCFHKRLFKSFFLAAGRGEAVEST